VDSADGFAPTRGWIMDVLASSSAHMIALEERKLLIDMWECVCGTILVTANTLTL
jgi:hypothetical protein